jgi:integrase
VKTKFSKTFTTFFFPVGEDVRQVVADWVRFLREEKQWGNDDPLFPKTRIVLGADRKFEAAGLERENWSTATPVRAIFREAFGRADLPYFHPHSLRKTLGRLGGEACSSAEEYKAWSQNLGHELVLTTLMSYGKVSTERQGEIIRGIGMLKQLTKPDVDDFAEAVVKRLRDAGASLPATF